MTTTRTNASFILAPEHTYDLLIAPAFDFAVTTRVATVVELADRQSSAFRVPVVQADPSAAWVAEGEEIPLSDAAFGEATANFHKLAALSVVTDELIFDSNPEAAAAIGAGIARDIARQLDAGFFGNLPAPAPAGLAGLAGVSEVVVATPGGIHDTDPFVSAIASADLVGARLTSFVANPADALKLALVKRAVGSNEPLLQPDASTGPHLTTRTATRRVAGLPLWVSPAVTEGTIWGIPDDRVYLALRGGSEIAASKDTFFISHRWALRGVMRLGWCFPHPAAIVKITTTNP